MYAFTNKIRSFTSVIVNVLYVDYVFNRGCHSDDGIVFESCVPWRSVSDILITSFNMIVSDLFISLTMTFDLSILEHRTPPFCLPFWYFNTETDSNQRSFTSFVVNRIKPRHIIPYPSLSTLSLLWQDDPT